MVVAGDLDSSKLFIADCLSSFVLQNSMAGPAREGLQLLNSRGHHNNSECKEEGLLLTAIPLIQRRAATESKPQTIIWNSENKSNKK